MNLDSSTLRSRGVDPEADEAVELLRTVIDLNPNLIFVKDRAGRFTLANRAVAEFYGTTVEELIGKTDGNFNSDAAQVAAFRRDDLEVMNSGHERVVAEEAVTDARGERRWMRTVKRPLPGPDGRIDRVLGVATEITELKRAEEEARRQATRFERVVDASPHGIAVTDEAGAIVLVNSALERMFGTARGELVGTPVERLVPEALRHQHAELRAHYTQDPHTLRLAGREVEGRRADGSTFRVEIGLSRFESFSGTRILATVVDVSARHELEANLERAQRLEAVGRVAGGVAHDFNNLLTVILAYAEMLRERLPPRDPGHGDLDEIRAAAEHGAALTRQLLVFGRPRPRRTERLDLHAVVTQIEKMLRRVLGSEIAVVVDTVPDLGEIEGDATQLEQVLMNLSLNARDAMPSGGVLSIATANVDLDVAAAGRHGVAPGRYVLLTVADTGIGMDETTRDHAFEPFFTTKAEGSGTGLGLATVEGIVRQSGGVVRLESRPGEGTRFEVLLPRAPDQPGGEG